MCLLLLNACDEDNYGNKPWFLLSAKEIYEDENTFGHYSSN